MKITGTLEEIESGSISETVVECEAYGAGFEALKRTIPDGIALLSVRVER